MGKVSQKRMLLNKLLASFIFYLMFLAMFRNFNIIFQHIVALPGYAIMVYGCYALITIGEAVENIKEYDDEKKSLQKDIKLATEFARLNNLN